MISLNDVKIMANLARIKLGSKEEKELAKDLESILGYIDKLKGLDLSGIEKEGLAANFNVFREDVSPKELFDSESLIDEAPEKEKGFIKVKKILDKYKTSN